MWSMVSKLADRSRRGSAVKDPLAKKNIIINIKGGTFSRMMLSISQLEDNHKTSFVKMSL